MAGAGGLRVRVLRRFGVLRGHPAYPVAPQLAWSLGGADIVHTHQLHSARVGLPASRPQRPDITV